MSDPVLPIDTVKENRVWEEAKSIAAYLCSDNPVQEALLLENSEPICAKVAGPPSPFQLRALRREIIRACIEICWDEIYVLILSYGSTESQQHDLISYLVPVERLQARLGDTTGRLNLLQRLTLLMVYREDYSARECASMLNTTDWVVHAICNHSLYAIRMDW